MRGHIFIAVGLILICIYIIRGYEALVEPGYGLRELYVLGGFTIAGVLIRMGWRAYKESGVAFFPRNQTPK